MGLTGSKAFDPIVDVPSLEGKVALVTGANRGLGYAVSLALAQKGAKVYVTCRSLSKAEEAVRGMSTVDPGVALRLRPLGVELGSVRSAKAAGEEVLREEGESGRLDILVCNAAQTGGPYAETEEGISTAIASNHLGHFALTKTLLPLLERTARLPGSDVRVISVSSDAHSFTPKPVQFKTVADFRQDCGSKKGSIVVEMTRYGQSKLANILFAKELQRRWTAAGVPGIALALHPGGISTQGARNFLGWWYLLFGLGFVSPEKAAGPVLLAAAGKRVREEGDKWKGAYVRPVGKVVAPSKEAEDMGLAKDLWELSERVCAEIEEKGRAE
ncbi:NAD(P)-binding protein [Calocera viscosa TUFC12733]|uniref:NAD(P)-binding protein n=1 Tax=Calocera viscosa (strain TUFC12733) TaxID=1330018 RepID=A0A167HRL3_CALVF|nr:NAD(P)-binding protein [Calocera viscosa TUFC12733]